MGNKNQQNKMIDIVFPNKNEKEFIEIAEKLKTRSIYFVYPQNRIKDISQSKIDITELQKTTNVRLLLGILADSKNIQKSRHQSIFTLIKSSVQDQYVLEKIKPSLIFDLENQYRKDKFNYRSSGLNQVLCSLANKNKIEVGISFSSILNSKDRTILFGRTIQNMRLCKKYNVNVHFASFANFPFEMRSAKDLKTFCNLLSNQ